MNSVVQTYTHNKHLVLGIFVSAVIFGMIGFSIGKDEGWDDRFKEESVHRGAVRALVENQARAWETGDVDLLQSTMHPDIVFAYPGRRLNFDETTADLEYFREQFEDTKVYIHDVIVDDDHVAVQWQFAATEKESGKRTVVSDGIIGRVKDGKLIEWKEYLDGRVSRMRKAGALPLEEGEEPFPSPKGSLRNFCDVTQTL